MLSKKQCEKKLSDMGVKTRFRVYQDESQVEMGKDFISIKATYKLYDDGSFKGNCINQISTTLWGIWTTRTKVVLALHAKHGWPVQRMNREALINVPISFSDEILPLFGARIRPPKRILTPEQLESLKARFQAARNLQSLRQKQAKTGVPEGSHAKEG